MQVQPQHTCSQHHKLTNCRKSLTCSSLLLPSTSKDASGKTSASRSTGGAALASKEDARGRGGSTAVVEPPPPVPTTPATGASSLQSAVSEFASQLVSSLPWTLSSSGDATLPAAAQQQLVAGRVQTQDEGGLELGPCLDPVPVWLLKHLRKLCHLTALTYKMHLVTPRAMRRRHQLTLVTTSWACEIRLYEHTKSAHEVAEDGDGMAVSVTDVRGTYQNLIGRQMPHPAQGDTVITKPVALSNIVPLPPLSSSVDDSKPQLGPTTPAVPHAAAAGTVEAQAKPEATEVAPASQQQQQDQRGGWQSPGHMVAAMVLEAASAATASVTPLASAAVTPIATAASAAVTPIASAASAAVTPIASAASAAVTPLASAAGSLYAGLASLPIASALGANPLSSAPAVAATIMSTAAAAVRGSGSADKPTSQGNTAQMMAVGLAAAAGPAAIAAAPGRSMRLAAPVQSTTGSPACPSEWFVCDDPATCTRYFIIQGSDSIDHWKLNLSFDPVPFENPALGVKVHRGAYEAAKILYERFLPMVYEHLDSSPFAKICFTGHSIGGSLGTLLAMMYHYRGVLPTANLATVYTFGSPAIFCMDAKPEPTSHSNQTTTQTSSSSQGHGQQTRSHSHSRHGHGHGHGHGQHRKHHHEPQHANKHHLVHHGKQQGNGNSIESSSKPNAVPCQCGAIEITSPLVAVGLREDVVRNVIMARDIVPKAFACDYQLVSEILKGWGPVFKTHGGLANRRKHLYFFAGRTMVLQPDGKWHWFAQPEPDHPLLPPGPNVYLVNNPSLATSAASASDARDTARKASQHAGPAVAPTERVVGHKQRRDMDRFNAAHDGVGLDLEDSEQAGGHAAGHVNGSAQVRNIHKAGPSCNGTIKLAVNEPQLSRVGNNDDVAMNGKTALFANGHKPAVHGDGGTADDTVEHAASSDVDAATLAQAATTAAHVRIATAAAAATVAPRTTSAPPAATTQLVHTGQGNSVTAGKVPRTASDALWALMDSPHPLEVLGDPGAYLERGSISRYHNPDNYTAALGRLIFLKRMQEGRIPRWVHHSYSRGLRMEAFEENQAEMDMAANGSRHVSSDLHADASIASWDSSDGDAGLLVMPGPLPVAAAHLMADALPW